VRVRIPPPAPVPIAFLAGRCSVPYTSRPHEHPDPAAALEECRLRMLIAETPVADRDLQRAAAVHALARAEVDRLERAMAALRDEQRRLVRGPA
jgi:hypothetical protein